MVEAQQHLQEPHHARALADRDHTARAHRRAGGGERRVVERQLLDLLAGEHLGRDAAWNDRLDRTAAEAAAAVVENELLERITAFDLVDAGPRDVPRDRDEPRSGI